MENCNLTNKIKIFNILKMECEATTNEGVRCSRTTELNSKYCWQHQNYNINTSETKINPYFQNADLLQSTLLPYFSSKAPLITINNQFNNLQYQKYTTHQIKETFYDNKQLHTRSSLKNNVLDGFYEEFYENGELKSRNNYKDGKKDGLYEQWKLKGKIKESGNYKNGEKDGLWIELPYNDEFLVETNYKNGKKDGVTTVFYLDKLYETLTYKNGELYGLHKRYNENGEVRSSVFEDERRDKPINYKNIFPMSAMKFGI